MEWFPNEVLWFIDGVLVRQSTTVPQGSMDFHLNFWAPDKDWADAYSSLLQPTANSQNKTIYNFDVQSVSVARIEDVNTTVTVKGTVANQSTSDTSSVSPFSGVVITDVNPGQTDTVSVTLSAAANGTLSNLNGGSYNATTGVYTVTGTAAAVTAALDGLVFTPTAHQLAQSVTTTFTIMATDTVGAIATDSTTTVVATSAPALATLASFNGTNGTGPEAGLFADAAGDLFSTTEAGGAHGDGTVFEVPYVNGSYASTPITLVSFNGTNGGAPNGGARMPV
jgi:hypothetical protein